MRCHFSRMTRIVLFLALLLGRKCRGQDDCSLEYDDYNDCVGSSGSGTSECEICVTSYYSNVLSLNFSAVYDIPCTEIGDETCDALSWCSSSCSTCRPEFVTYFECKSACSLDEYSCSSTTDSTPSSNPTPAPTVLECPDELGALNQCIEQNGAASDCVSCIKDYFPEDNVQTCAYSELLTCNVMSECPICGDCHEEMVDWTNCLNQGDCVAFDCGAPTLRPSAAPATAPTSTIAPTLAAETEPPSNGPGNVDDDGNGSATCGTLQGGLDECLSENLPASQSASCKLCVEAKFDQLLEARTATKCSTIESELCDAVAETCDCGKCASAYHDLVRCRVDGSDTGCRFRCEGITSSTSRVGSWGVEPSLAIQISLFLMLGVVL